MRRKQHILMINRLLGMRITKEDPEVSVLEPRSRNSSLSLPEVAFGEMVL